MLALTLLSLLPLVEAQTIYKARFHEDVTGVSGQFNLKIKKENHASYQWSINANNFVSPNTCDLSAGLSYHIHSFWNNNYKDSAIFSDCGGPNLGGHYDPFLACSGATSSVAECAALGRRSDDYSCDTTKYLNGEYQFCEVGDLSGKFGKMMPNSAVDLTFEGEEILDYFGPLKANYDVNYDAPEEGITKSWVSIVFHCASDGSRQFCAKLIR